jgi:GNAT superfamily N-acetyltransferase
MLWIARHSPSAHFVYDVAIEQALRGHGYGRAAMNVLAAWSRERGSKVLALNVFGQNRVARNLYRSLGYRVVVEEMALDLTTRPRHGDGPRAVGEVRPGANE